MIKYLCCVEFFEFPSLYDLACLLSLLNAQHLLPLSFLKKNVV